MKKIFVYVRACRRRAIDAAKICKYLSKNGYEIVNAPNNADCIIFVTCAFLDEVAESVLTKIREFQGYDAELIVAGCLPGIEPVKLSKIFSGKTISTKDLEKIDDLFPDNKIKFCDIEDANAPLKISLGTKSVENIKTSKIVIRFKKFLRVIQWIEKVYLKLDYHLFKNRFDEKSYILGVLTNKPYFFIRTSSGCPSDCSYCAIKMAVGALKSKPLNQCINDFKKGLKLGYKTFMIDADNTGAYGIDIGSSFPELLDEMTKIPGDYEISIININPVWIIKYIDQLEEILKRKKITRLDIPLQSGSSRILKLMNRYHDVEKIKTALLKINALPGLILTTEIIVGFPTESEDELKQTLSLIKELNFGGGNVFAFSQKSGTRAEKIEPQVPQKEIMRRMKYAKKFLKKSGYIIPYSSDSYFIFNLKIN